MDAHDVALAQISHLPLPLRPDDLDEFRLARLLLLLNVVHEHASAKPLDIERLGYYDFFAANPFLVFDNKSPEYKAMVLAGFESKNLSYQSSAQRFTNRRGRLQHDLSRLVAYNLAGAIVSHGRVTYAITASGQKFTSQLQALYALAYQRSARIVVKKLGALSDRRLEDDAKHWLRAESLMIDIFDVDGE